jgi:hypothetical protein
MTLVFLLTRVTDGYMALEILLVLEFCVTLLANDGSLNASRTMCARRVALQRPLVTKRLLALAACD